MASGSLGDAAGAPVPVLHAARRMAMVRATITGASRDR
jgi:hypothetical protein